MLATTAFGRRSSGASHLLRRLPPCLPDALAPQLSPPLFTRAMAHAGEWFLPIDSMPPATPWNLSLRKQTMLSKNKSAEHRKIGFGCIIAGKHLSQIFF